MTATTVNSQEKSGAMIPQAGTLQKNEARPNNAEKFTARVMREFGGSVGEIQVTDYQHQLIQGYFIAIDRALKLAEEERQRKNDKNTNHQYDNNVPVTWANVNLNDLALDVVHYARMGLDMMQENHLFPIPYKNGKTNKYDITLMPGYNGVQYIAERYAVDPPIAVTVELVYSTDTFRPIKKSAENRVENYEFAINNAFDRGEFLGGFGYLEFADPLKNKLVVMSKRDIEKRKPKYASANFWGGKDNVGWYEEMCIKTIKREVYSAKHIPRDPKKIDDNYQYMKFREAKIAEMEAQEIIDENANGIVIDVTPDALPKTATTEFPPPPQAVEPVGQAKTAIQEQTPPVSAAIQNDGQTTMGPTF